MRNTWVRSVLGLGAVLLVAGPSMVLAVYDPSYTPKSLVVQGPGSLGNNVNQQYTAFVTFTNGQTASFPPTVGPVMWSTTNPAVATVNSTGLVTTTATDGLVGIQASLTQQGVKVGGVKLVRVQ